MSLRTRLVLGTLALATLGLLVADVVTYTSLRSFLVDQVDGNLQSDHIAIERDIGGPVTATSCDGLRSLDPEVFVQLRTGTGTVVCTERAAHISLLRLPHTP